MLSELPASSRIIFVSDAHIGALSSPKNKELEREFISLIDFAETEGYEIAVLGDLFDYWIEYRGFTPALGQSLLCRFKEFNTRTGSSLYITGNHDNWTLGHFADCGFDVEPNYRIIYINNLKILMIHGDATGNHPEKLERPLFHRFLRNERFLRIYRGFFPPKVGLKLMKTFSNMSRFFSGNRSEPKKLDHWTKKMLKNTSIDVILCGHDHVPRILKYDYGTYINLGNFQYQRSLVEYNKRRFSLVRWNSKQRRLIPFQDQFFSHE